MHTFIKKAITGLSLTAIILLVAPSLQAQVLAHSADFAGFGGYGHASYNKPVPFGNTHTNYGASGGYNVTSNITALGEYNYQPADSAFGQNFSAQLFGGAVRYNFLSSKRIVPYVVAGAGDFRFNISNSSSTSYTGYYMTYGGGASIYLGKHWGVRPEFRYDRRQVSIQNTTYDADFLRESGAVFYQWGGRSKKQK